MSLRYEFGTGGAYWADVDDLDHFEDVQSDEQYLVIGDPGGCAYVLYGTRQGIADELRTMLAYVESVPPAERVDDPQDPRLVGDSDGDVTDEFFYFDGEQWITVESHTHEMEDHGHVMVCSECPYSRPLTDAEKAAQDD